MKAELLNIIFITLTLQRLRVSGSCNAKPAKSPKFSLVLQNPKQKK